MERTANLGLAKLNHGEPEHSYFRPIQLADKHVFFIFWYKCESRPRPLKVVLAECLFWRGVVEEGRNVLAPMGRGLDVNQYRAMLAWERCSGTDVEEDPAYRLGP
jgi:hypothetical protein